MFETILKCESTITQRRKVKWMTSHSVMWQECVVWTYWPLEQLTDALCPVLYFSVYTIFFSLSERKSKRTYILHTKGHIFYDISNFFRLPTSGVPTQKFPKWRAYCSSFDVALWLQWCMSCCFVFGGSTMLYTKRQWSWTISIRSLLTTNSHN